MSDIDPNNEGLEQSRMSLFTCMKVLWKDSNSQNLSEEEKTVMATAYV